MQDDFKGKFSQIKACFYICLLKSKIPSPGKSKKRKLQVHYLAGDISKQHTANSQPHRYCGDRRFLRKAKKTRG